MFVLGTTILFKAIAESVCLIFKWGGCFQMKCVGSCRVGGYMWLSVVVCVCATARMVLVDQGRFLIIDSFRQVPTQTVAKKSQG